MSHVSLGLPVHVPRYGTTGLCTRLPLVNKTTNRGWGGKGLLKGLALYVTGRPFQRASARTPVTGPQDPLHHPPSHYRPETLLLPSMSLPADHSRAGGGLLGKPPRQHYIQLMHQGHGVVLAAWRPGEGLRDRCDRAWLVYQRKSSFDAFEIGPVPASRGSRGVSSGNCRCIQYPQ